MSIVVKPFITYVNKTYQESFSLKARCLKDYKSRTKKEEYVFVSMDKEGNDYIVSPITGRSGCISSILNAAGFIKIRPSDDGVKEGQCVEVILF
jgi:molybdopterin biosynthesis enzyme